MIKRWADEMSKVIGHLIFALWHPVPGVLVIFHLSPFSLFEFIFRRVTVIEVWNGRRDHYQKKQ